PRAGGSGQHRSNRPYRVSLSLRTPEHLSPPPAARSGAVGAPPTRRRMPLIPTSGSIPRAFPLLSYGGDKAAAANPRQLLAFQRERTDRQFSRGVHPGEEDEKRQQEAKASMGPRSDNRGYVLRSSGCQAEVYASMGPRSDNRGYAVRYQNKV